MSPLLRGVLWVVSSAAVVWLAAALAMAARMGSTGGMMGGMMRGGCPMCPMMSGAGGGGMMEGGMMGWPMMLGMALWWLVVLALAGVFVYLAVSALRGRRHAR